MEKKKERKKGLTKKKQKTGSRCSESEKVRRKSAASKRKDRDIKKRLGKSVKYTKGGKKKKQLRER